MVARTEEPTTTEDPAGRREGDGPGRHGASGARVAGPAAAAAAGYVLFSVVVASAVDMSSPSGQIVWTLVPIPASGAFAAGCVVLVRRCTGQRRRFWFVLAVGVTVMFAAQIWRAAGLVLHVPTDLRESVYAASTTVGIVTFTAALVTRLRMIAPATWGVQLVDAAGIGVVVSTLVAFPLANRLAGAPLDVHLTIAQPLVLVILASGTGGLILTPVPWREKRTEALLSAATALGVVQAWVEVYGIVHTGERFLPATLVLLTAAFALAAVSPVLEDPAAGIRPFLREDYDASALPYVALGVLPMLAVGALVHGTQAQVQVAVIGMLAGFAVVVLRQVQVLHTQRVLLEREQGITEERLHDTRIARALLGVAADLSVSPDRVTAERAVLNALAGATTSSRVRIVDRAGRVAGDEASHAWLGPEAAVALVVDPLGRAGMATPRHFSDPVAGVGGLLAPALDSRGELSAVLCAEGRAWRPTPNETDLMAGLARQLGVALERAELFAHLAESESRYRQVVDHLPVGIVEFDAAGRVLRTNAAFGQVCGREPAEIVGDHVLAPFSVFEPEPADALAHLLATGEARCRARVVAADGAVRVLEIDAARLAASATGDTVMTVRDVTATARLRSRIHEAAVRLERREGCGEGVDLAPACAAAILLMEEAAAAAGRLDEMPPSARQGLQDTAEEALAGAIDGLGSIVATLGDGK